MVYPNILPPSVAKAASGASGSSAPPAPHPPRVEYLATLAKHQAAVNVVRFSPNGELIASAGDDGMVIIWSPSSTAPSAAFGQDADELSYEKEYWKARTPFRCTTMQVYDLAWSPTGEYIITGSTDNTARIFSTADGKCIREIAEHSHYVQGVAWDPLNEFIATQSSDRAVHVYNVNASHGPAAFEVHAVGKNTKMVVNHVRTPSASMSRKRPRTSRRESVASDCESAVASDVEEIKPPLPPPLSSVPLTPAPSIASTPSASGPVFLPPPTDRTTSRRSSFSSAAPGSPAQSHYSSSAVARSPSPMPPLPAIRAPPSPQLLAQTRLYGDESFTNFYRRLTFSPDGGLLLTPSGHFEDPSNISALMGEFSRGRRGNPADTFSNPSSESSVYIYSRANFARPPIAQLPGHKKASVAVKFSSLLYELRPNVLGANAPPEPKTVNVAVERGGNESADVDMVGPLPLSALETGNRDVPGRRSAPSPSPQTPHPSQTLPSPALSAIDNTNTNNSAGSMVAPQTPARKTPSSASATPSGAGGSAQSQGATQTGSIFALPYRMLFAVATKDAITIHDTQQASPIALLTKLHYDEFTDMAWSPDGQTLILTSRDGYCTIVIFDQPIPIYQTQPFHPHSHSFSHGHSHSHSHMGTLHSTPMKRNVPLPSPERPGSTSTSVTPGTPNVLTGSLGLARTPAPTTESSQASVTTLAASASAASVASAFSESGAESGVAPDGEAATNAPEPPKKKRRVVLTRIGDVDT